MRALRYLWAMPATLIGLLLGLCAGLAGARWQSVEGVVEIVGGAFIAVLLRGRNGRSFAALTLGHVILATDDPALQRCRAHEYAHVRQYERWGLFFFPVYAGSSLYQLLRGRDPYFDNRFEKEARARAGET